MSPTPGKRALDTRAAEATGVPFRDVQRITAAFLQAARDALLDTREVALPPLGTLTLFQHRRKRAQVVNLRTYSDRPLAVEVDTAFTLRFRKDPRLRALIRARLLASEENKVMEKFAVDEDLGDQEALEKKAAGGCPRCGATPQRHGRSLICPKCGSEPFEGSGDKK